ncbi:unnamed protein product [Protopolystoma xenopodis]|uniref:Uncharacterized protein n=1 Tax=Protopolystoma xenopodis TaxID=117903 RepID=A0A3S5AZF6_9PLAT|nr:unnamed protein product [Protopolystoma xenopodis]
MHSFTHLPLKSSFADTLMKQASLVLHPAARLAFSALLLFSGARFCGKQIAADERASAFAFESPSSCNSLSIAAATMPSWSTITSATSNIATTPRNLANASTEASHSPDSKEPQAVRSFQSLVINRAVCGCHLFTHGILTPVDLAKLRAKQRTYRQICEKRESSDRTWASNGDSSAKLARESFTSNASNPVDQEEAEKLKGMDQILKSFPPLIVELDLRHPVNETVIF